ncbi:hypothetical protein A2160_02825 [Candidatus Beckwithbacteria bacterium RBG_13_42_9]|uniref:Glycosyltransferase 2-like domain-containing protein n=1 Tax=Candidatus Beckwithbacteria bacterium RBG_13_42_9 TaxID=1797457 RepID=A0A1F5E7L4_9BACT|nr:MAG: hypothetical protein A2160_02825 [Candidatus Beckwithbacteria bacterium RBG_13_42_9]
MKISVILPTYNESHNIINLVQAILKTLSKNVECLIIDDDSPDGTGKLVKEKFLNNKKVRCFIRKGKRDLGKAIAYGLSQVKGDMIIIMDSDFNHQPKYLPKFVEKINNYDIICGSRYIKGGGMPGNHLRLIGSYIFNCFIRLTLGMHLTDNLSGFLAFRRSVLGLLNPTTKQKISMALVSGTSASNGGLRKIV